LCDDDPHPVVELLLYSCEKMPVEGKEHVLIFAEQDRYNAKRSCYTGVYDFTGYDTAFFNVLKNISFKSSID